MKVDLKPGKYVIAVSGGVDSIALLHKLKNLSGLKLIVAHFDHGIRPDSNEDRRFVQNEAKLYKLPFVYDQGRLGARVSEAAARAARYDFLHKVRNASGARAIVTAHHQDDALETAILNILRGSGRLGLTSLASNQEIVRPLLHIPKRDIITYAKDKELNWREDTTNQDQTYLRNYIRHRLLPRFNEQNRTKLWEIITKVRETNLQLDALLVNQLHIQPLRDSLERQWFNHLPHSVAREVLATWLRAHGLRDFDTRALERLVVAAKIARAGSRFDVIRSVIMAVSNDHLALKVLER